MEAPAPAPAPGRTPCGRGARRRSASAGTGGRGARVPHSLASIGVLAAAVDGWADGWAWSFGNSNICAGNPPKQPNFGPAHSAQVTDSGVWAFVELLAAMPRDESGVDNSPNRSDPNPNFEDMEKNF